MKLLITISLLSALAACSKDCNEDFDCPGDQICENFSCTAFIEPVLPQILPADEYFDQDLHPWDPLPYEDDDVIGPVPIDPVDPTPLPQPLPSPKPTEPKESWPQLKGMKGEDAVKIIQKQNPELKVSIVPFGFLVTMDYRTDRVRVWVDKKGYVSETPRIG